MTGDYVGDYGESFLGIGYEYCHPTLATTTSSWSTPGDIAIPTGTKTTMSVEWSKANGIGGVNVKSSATTADIIDFHPYAAGSENNSGVFFVAAKRMKGFNGPSDSVQTLDCGELRAQQEREANIARSKAMDIVRNILQNDGENSAAINTTANMDAEKVSIENNNNFNIHCPSNFTKTMLGQQSTPHPPSTASIESDAQNARKKALEIIRKFQSKPENGYHNEIGAAVNQSENSANTAWGQSSEQPASTSGSDDRSFFGPQETLSIRTNSKHVTTHPIPTEQYAPSYFQAQHPPTPIMVDKTQVVAATTPPWELGRRRRECLDRDEARKKRALFKNLEYVARLEEARLVQELDQVQQARTLEEQIDERYRQKLEKRSRNHRNDGRNDINTSGAGIGTKQRRKAECKRQRTALPQSLRNYTNASNHKKDDANGTGGGSRSFAIYVSNIPTDGSVDDETIRALFASYGSLRKVHFYVHKSSGRRKGDALVIYSLNGEDDEASLTESVCSQVNGCELPGGSILCVQPSDPYHEVTKKQGLNGSATALYSKVGVPTPTITKESLQTTGIAEHPTHITKSEGIEEQRNGDEPDGEEDLDDFFASLE